MMAPGFKKPAVTARWPAELSASTTGTIGCNIQAADHVDWLSRFLEFVTEQPEDLINAVLEDPWAFIGLTQKVPKDWPTIRFSIEFLAWPGYLQPVVSRDHRIKITDSFAGIIGGPTGDTDLHIA